MFSFSMKPKILNRNEKINSLMRTFTLIIVIFIAVIMFFEITDWTPTVPTTKEVTTQKTVIVETVDQNTGEVMNTTTNKTITQMQDNR